MPSTAAARVLDDTLDPTSAILIAEHDRLVSLYQHNATMGDRFVATYLAVVSLAVVLIAGLRDLLPSSNMAMLIELTLLIIVMTTGATIFRRLVERRIHAIEYLRAINRIHRYFVDQDPKSQRYFYWSACDDSPPIQIKGTVVGGLLDMVAVLNSLFVGFTLSVITKVWWPVMSIPLSALIGVVTGTGVWFIQSWFSKVALSRAERAMDRYVSFPRSEQTA